MNHGGYYFVQTIFYFPQFHYLKLKISKTKSHLAAGNMVRDIAGKTNTRCVILVPIKCIICKDINMIIFVFIHGEIRI